MKSGNSSSRLIRLLIYVNHLCPKYDIANGTKVVLCLKLVKKLGYRNIKNIIY